MSDFFVEVLGTEKLARKFERDPEKVIKLAEKLLKQEARATAADLGQATSPRDVGQYRKYRDIIERQFNAKYAQIDGDLAREASKIYTLLKRINPKRAAPFWALYKSGQTEEAMIYASRSRLPRRVNLQDYRAQRDQKGHVIAAGAAVNVQKNLARHLRTIGTAKAGWLAAQRAVGGRTTAARNKFPRYVTDALRASKGETLGSATFRNHRSSGLAILTLRNHVSYIRNALPERLEQRAVDRAETRFREDIEKGWHAINSRSSRG